MINAETSENPFNIKEYLINTPTGKDKCGLGKGDIKKYGSP